jgi:hypothetical protein
MRTVGHVTAVVTGRDVVWERPPNAPHERAVALRLDPRVVVVADPESFEPRLLGHPGLLDQRPRPELLAGEEVPDLHRVPFDDDMRPG